MTEDMDLETKLRLNELIGDYDVNSEEEAMAYLKFLEAKMDELSLSTEAMAKQEAERWETQVGKAPRPVRRMMTKKGAKFSDRFKASINTKK